MKYLILKTEFRPTHIDEDGNKVRAITEDKIGRLGPTQVLVDNLDGLTSIVETSKVPQEVPLWAFRTVATSAGLLDDIVAAIGLLDEPGKTAATNLWEYGNVVTRKSPTVLSLAPALGLSSEQVDDFFRQAAALVI